ncbi:MAG: alpha-N-arabinofuranosidase [Ruminococcaceae bacterium]|nr:alpha-N-arabinofuranosidase [Oscillospiraceae bacterium]
MKKLHVLYHDRISTIAPEIYGHFSEHIGGVIYDGIWVGKDSPIPNVRGFRKDLVKKFKRIKPAVLRWPGGCFAETYNWRDGIGKDRPTRLNWWTPYDHRYESNEVGTHEFMDFCEMVGTKAYFAMNITSITPMQAREWMEYCLAPKGSTTLALERERNGRAEPFDIPYWGVGNENWGGGGNMTPEFYALEYRRFSTLMRNITRDLGGTLIAGGADGKDYNWTHGLAKVLSTSEKHVGGMSFHYYTGVKDPLTKKKYEALDCSESAWYATMEKAEGIEDAIKRHYSIAQAYGMEDKLKLVIDEWGCWHPDGSGPTKGYNLFEQQSSMKDAVVTALHLNIFNNHSDKIMMANVAQLCNNIHCLFLANKENCITTPTYHVFDMFKEHQGALALKTVAEENDDITEKISSSASLKDGKFLITLANLSLEKDVELSVDVPGISVDEEAEASVLSTEKADAHNTFAEPEAVTPQVVFVDLSKPLTLKKHSVTAITVKIK